MNETSPLVSVIIATYNWSSVLRCAIQSVLGQTFQDFELLVVGDGCADDSAQVAASFTDPRIRWHNLEKNSGHQSAPNNAGLEMARGKYIAYLGHDDIWFPTHLALLVQALQNSSADLAYSIAVMIGPPSSGVRIATGIFPDGQYAPDMFLLPSSIMHTRDVIKTIGVWRDYRTLKIPPDKEFVERIWRHRQQFASVNELTVFKFNSAWRPNSYREKPCHEQTEYLRRIQCEPNFLSRELLAIVEACVLRKNRTPTNIPRSDCPEALPPGWLVEQWRRIRGVTPNEVAQPGPARALVYRYKKSRKKLARNFRRLAAWLDN